METLKDYFSYENDLDNISEIFDNLSRQLKIIHSKNMVVTNLNSSEIDYEDTLSFKSMRPSDNIEVEKRSNILSLAKIMIGTCLSSGVGYKDFSSVEDSWFIDNFDNIFDAITVKNIDKDYFSSIFLEGKNYYYSDYLDRKKQGESLQGKSNVQGYKKVLKTAGSSLYEDLSEQESNIKDKNANIQVEFNPLLIGLSITIITILVIMLALVK